MGGNTSDRRGASSDRTDGWDRPSRRTVLGGLGGVAAGSLAVGQVSGQFGSSGPATPTVEGPVEGGSQTGRPMTAAPHDFESYGYVEEEYFISGTAEQLGSGGLLGGLLGGSDSGSSGSSGSSSGPADYKTRILVYRPEDPADFNGGVLAEWFNVSLQTDFPVAWPNAYEYLHRNGWAIVLVSAQKVGVDNSSEDLDLVTWDSERYGDLNHPGDEYALDIFAQAIQAVRQEGDDGSTTGTSGGLWGSGGSSDGSSGGLWGSGGSDDGGSSGGLWGSGGSSGGSSSGSSGGLLGAGLTLGQIGGGSSGGLWGSGGSDDGGSSGGLWGSGGSDDSGSSGGLWGSGGSGGTSGGTGGTGGDPHPLGGLNAEYVIATGQSQSSFYISSFISDVEPDYDIVDGFLPAAGMPNVPTDVDPTIWLNTMSEAGGNLLEGSDDLPGNESLPDIPPELLESLLGGGPPADEGQFRLWEVAGAVHVNQWLSRWAGAARRRDFGTDDPTWDPQAAANYGELEEGNYGECDYNYFPARYVYSAALEALRAWIQEGTPAPNAPRMERVEEEQGTSLARDEHGNAVGGIRLPPVDVPVATYEAGDCGLTGMTTRFDESTLDSLYPTHDGYVSQFEAVAQQAVQDGFLLQADAEDLVARAEASPIGQ